jgi:hypothetical protein
MTAPVGPVYPAGGRRRTRIRDVVTPFRILCTAALTAAAFLFVFGFQASVDQRAVTCGSATAPIVHLFPCPGDTDLRQGIIGASLGAGLTGVIIVDYHEIPLDQMRTGGANQIYFQPGPGTETGALAPGVHSASVIYWPVTGTREHDAKEFPWSFSVT